MTKTPSKPVVRSAKDSLLGGGVDGRTVPLFGPADSPPVEKTFNFPLQAFLDTRFAEAPYTVAAQAMLSQPSENKIVPNGLKSLDEGGYGVALLPDSDTPLAINFKGSTGARSGPLILRPGETIWPFGTKRSFESADVGLPQGWLGGGWASLLVLKSPKSKVAFPSGEKEVLFHRFQTRIREASIDPPAIIPTNWPTSFPWQRARRGRYDPGTVNVSGRFEDQNGTTTLAIKRVTRTLLRLNGVALDGSTENEGLMRIVWWSSDHLDAGLDGLFVGEPGAGSPLNFYIDVNWPLNTVNGLPAHNQILSIDPAFASQRCSLYGITLDALAGSPLIGQTVDIVRYGIL